MKLEKQVVSLELAKKLKSLNVKQESLWYWGKVETDSEFRLMNSTGAELCKEAYSAFTVAELLQMLKEPVIVPVDGSASDYLADLIIKQYEDGDKH